MAKRVDSSSALAPVGYAPFGLALPFKRRAACEPLRRRLGAGSSSKLRGSKVVQALIGFGHGEGQQVPKYATYPTILQHTDGP